MKRVFLLVFMTMSYSGYAQNESPIFSINDKSVCADQAYISTNDSCEVAYTPHTAGRVSIGDVVYTIRTAKFSGWDNEPGFNVIEISKGDSTVFRHRQTDGLIKFDEDLYGRTLQRFSDNNYFIASRLSEDVTILIFAGWSYGNTPSQLLMIALTPEDVKTVYNKPANIISMTNRTNRVSIDIQTSIPEFDERKPACTIFEKDGILWIKAL